LLVYLTDSEAIGQRAQIEMTRKPSLWTILAGYGLAVLCLIWVLHDIHPGKALHDMANVDWRWVAAGIACDVLSYVVQAIRWKILLRPFATVRLSHSLRAVFAGLFANQVLPLRPGEFLRTYLLSKSENIKFAQVLASIGIERLIDLVIILLGLGFASLFVPLPEHFKKVSSVVGFITLALVGSLIAVIVYLEVTMGHRRPKANCPENPSRVASILLGLHAVGTSPSFYLAVIVSAGLPSLQILGLWAMMCAYSMTLPFLAAAVVLLIINLGVSLPNAPANVGSYQFFCVLGLSVFDLEKTTAAGFSIFAFLALTIPLFILGFWALMRTGLSFHEMREQLKGGLPLENRPVG
jgi:uncharacterized membrane protein YbhN (UPF0104 family)